MTALTIILIFVLLVSIISNFTLVNKIEQMEDRLSREYIPKTDIILQNAINCACEWANEHEYVIQQREFQRLKTQIKGVG